MVDVLILGGGYAGLGAAYRLRDSGLSTMLLEAEPRLGGHGLCTRIAGHEIESFYHHFKPEDRHLLDLVAETGLASRLRWRSTRMGFFVEGRLYPFSSPLDLLRFRPFSLSDKLRFARGVLRARGSSSASLENVSARDWIMREWSPTIYETVLRRLIGNKFATNPDQVSAAFLHGRIKAVAGTKSRFRGGERLAYLEGALDPLTERLFNSLRPATDVRLGSRVERIEKTANGYSVRCGDEWIAARRVINTLPTSTFERIPKNFAFVNPIDYQGAVCAIFAVREPLTSLYWVNVIDESIRFKLFVNQSMLGRYSSTIVYCSSYVPVTDPLLTRDAGEVLEEFLSDLRRMFGRVTVIDRTLTRSVTATPIFDSAYRGKISSLERFLPELAFAGNLMVFPGARTLSSVIGTGYAAADCVRDGLMCASPPSNPASTGRPVSTA